MGSGGLPLRVRGVPVPASSRSGEGADRAGSPEAVAREEQPPLAIDLCCGRGGWARGLRDAGFRVIGFDRVNERKWYPGEFVRADIRRLDGRPWKGRVRVIVASPPCTEFSPVTNLAVVRWGRAKPDPEKGMILVRETVRLIQEAEPTYWAIENVRGAVSRVSEELGRPRFIKNAWVLWGNFPGFLLPSSNRRFKFSKLKNGAVYRWPQGHNSKRASSGTPGANALIPYWLAGPFARACYGGVGGERRGEAPKA
jgi:site-specific DNA-cytosine methylase